MSRRTHDEAKPSFLTTVDGVWAWTLVSAVAIGYILSRGLAKSGSTRISNDDR